MQNKIVLANKLSVIIPVYNAEAYLEKCVESVLALPYSKEIILIDDGSKDKSGEICDKLAIRNSEVYVVHQENLGVSAARNRGLGIATGGYVWFVDADDYVELGKGYEVIGNRCSQEQSKLVLLPFVWEENGVAKEYEAYHDEVPYNLWRCWFDREEIERQGLRFTVGRKYAEDQEFILKFLLGCHRNPQNSRKTKTAVASPRYYYTIRPGSAMTRPGMKKKMFKDVSAVLLGFFGNALVSGAITKKWVWGELRRMTRTVLRTMGI